MQVPKGNVLFEGELLPARDIGILVSNLETDHFTGFVKMDLGDSCGYIFFADGELVRTLEVEAASDATSVLLFERFINRVKSKDFSVSTYVASPQIVGVLSGLFAFQAHYMDYEVKGRDFKKVLENLQSGKCCGILKVASREGTHFLIVDNGSLVVDRFSHHYGEILCGSDEVRQLQEYVNTTGAAISVYAEKAEEIEAKRRQKEEELEKIKSLVAKQEGGFLRASDTVRVDDYVIREWGIDAKTRFNVEVETPDGDLIVYKCEGAKKMSSYAGVTSAMMKRMNIVEGDSLSIRPVM